MSYQLDEATKIALLACTFQSIVFEMFPSAWNAWNKPTKAEQYEEYTAWSEHAALALFRAAYLNHAGLTFPDAQSLRAFENCGPMTSFADYRRVVEESETAQSEFRTHLATSYPQAWYQYIPGVAERTFYSFMKLTALALKEHDQVTYDATLGYGGGLLNIAIIYRFINDEAAAIFDPKTLLFVPDYPKEYPESAPLKNYNPELWDSHEIGYLVPEFITLDMPGNPGERLHPVIFGEGTLVKHDSKDSRAFLRKQAVKWLERLRKENPF